MAKKILLSSLESERSLASFEDYLYILSQLAVKPEGTKFIKAKTSLIFEEQSGGRRDAISDQIAWFRETVLLKDAKHIRKLHYLGVCMLAQWIGRSARFQELLASLAGTEKPSPLIQQQLVNCFLSSYIIQLVNQYNLNQSESGEKKANKLQQANTQELQKALNDMFSLQIHVDIVLKVIGVGSEDSELSLKDKMELLPLKTNTLQLLIEKITSYNQGFLSKATSSLQQVFKSLISEAVSMLNEFLPVFKGKKANMQPY